MEQKPIDTIFPILGLMIKQLNKKTMNQKKINELKQWIDGDKPDMQGPEHAKSGRERALEIIAEGQRSLECDNKTPPITSQKQSIDSNKNSSSEPTSNKDAALPSAIGLPFHNPYTFIPFPDKKNKSHRRKPTPLTIDELEINRKTGILELEVKTLSPLLCSFATPVETNSVHKQYTALSIGNDVIVPASSIRGFLSTLMTIITGGTLRYIDKELWLCQGRDVSLRPIKDKGKNFGPFLAEVIKPGDSQHSGTIKLGETKLVHIDKLEKINNFDLKKYTPNNTDPKIKRVWIDIPDNPTSFSEYEDHDHQWLLKLCYKPIRKKNSVAGAFKPGNTEIELSKKLWQEYQGRNRHSIRKELRSKDLIWLEPSDATLTKIIDEKNIASLQWARWGRKGESLINQLPEHVKPDFLCPIDGEIDTITELFGHVPLEGTKKTATSFAGRIRPHNLIFMDAKPRLKCKVTLAPLLAPHPGCIGFYRDDDPDSINQQSSPLKGYKVYRNTKEKGENAPWNYAVQGIYDNGKLKNPAQQNCNKTVDLLNEGETGTVRIAFRALDDTDLALLMTACTLDWKLGGGKPLGLGYCRVISLKLLNEDGEVEAGFPIVAQGDDQIQLPDLYAKAMSPFHSRIALYQASQKPVECLRYPRAVTQNQNKINRSGHVWFTRHAAPKKNEQSQGPGLATIWTRGELRKKVSDNSQIKAQALPRLDPNNSNADVLYGYDGIDVKVENPRKDKKYIGDIEQFNEKKHIHPNKKVSENTSQNKESRSKFKESR